MTAAAPPSTRPIVLVTGAGGFIGRAVVECFAADFDVVALDRDAPHAPPSVEAIALDVTSDDSVGAALDRVRFAHGDRLASVVHLAAYFDLTGEPDPRYDAVTVHGTERLLKTLREKGFRVDQFVFLSTMLVHAAGGPDRPIDEDAPLDDRFPYRASKIRTEAMLRETHGDVPLVILRPAGVYDDRCHSAFLAHQIARVYEHRLTGYVYPGDLAAGQPFLHLDDLLDALRRAVDRRAELPTETTLLLGEADVMRFDEIQHAIARLAHDEPWHTRSIPPALARAGAWVQDKVLDEEPFIRPWMVDIADDDYRLDLGRAAHLLDWHPVRTLRATLPTMIDALKRDPVGWYADNQLDAAVVAADGVAAQQASEKPDDSSGGSAKDPPSDMRAMHFGMLWVHWVEILPGAWLVASPFAFGSFAPTGFSDAVLHVTADRGLADPLLRSVLLGRSDVISGLLVMAFGALSLSPRFSWAQWANAAMGIWLTFAPLVFWAPTAAAYTNDTFTGALVIAFAILIPMMPGMSRAGMDDDSDLPPGWTYSPSTYLQRLPIIALGAFGFLVARTLAAYQLGHIGGVWEPFFAGFPPKNGTEAIITSSVSKAWPIADGGLGGVAYLSEILMGVMGDRRRWRTMPWMVAMFGIVVVPLGVVSIYFIVIQPIVIGTWCTLCLATAAAMLVMIPYSLDELVAMGQFLVQSHRRGEPFWSTFFRGGAQPAGGRDDRAGFAAPFNEAVASAVRGVALPWTLVVSAALGAFLMFTRVVFGTVPPMANHDHFVGALIVTFAVMAMAEVGRALRFANVAFGLWLAIAPFLVAGSSRFASTADVLVGLAVVLLALPRGKRSAEHYGAWDRLVV